MKYKATVKSRQFVLSEKGKKIYITPGDGDMTEEDAYQVAKSKWGKHLIEKGLLKFEKTIEVKEDKIQRGMTIKRGEVKEGRKGKEKEKPANDVTGSGDEPGADPVVENNEDDETGGDGGVTIEREPSEQIPDFDENSGEAGKS